MSKTKIDKTVPVTVVAVERNLAGSIDKYKLSNGKIIERDKMVILVENGWLPGYEVAIDKFGGKSIKVNMRAEYKRLQTLPDIQA